MSQIAFIREYMTEVLMNFSKSFPVTLLTAMSEWILFSLLSSLRWKEQAWTLRIRVLPFALGYLCIEMMHLPVSAHCVFGIAVCALCLWLVEKRSWYNAAFESSMFVLMIEIGKALFRNAGYPYLIYRAAEMLGHPASIYGVTIVSFGTYLVYLVLCGCFMRKIRSDLKYLKVSAAQTGGLLFPVLLYLVVRQTQSDMVLVDGEINISVWQTMDWISLGVAVCALIVIWVTTRMLSAQMEKNELLQQRILMDKQHSQYLIQKEAMDAVNRKYHDLKHFLRAARQEKGSAEFDHFITELQREIEPFETIQETGNRVLNVLVAERIRQCQELGIRLIPSIDGRGLGFMQTMDLCVLFGNAMDNAVEAVKRLEDPDLREIRVRIASSGEMTVMNFQNNCEGPDMEDAASAPTTKKDAANHGFGLSSIRSTAEKYGGTMKAEAKDGQYELTILIPMNQSGQSGDGSVN